MKKSNVTEEIMQYMRDQIVSEKWAIGSKIPSENELCRELGYSRTSVRSALQRFNVLGVLKSEKGRGTFVQTDQIYLYGDYLKNTDDEDMNVRKYMEWRQARNIIEPEIAAKVAKIATDEFGEKLNKINQEQMAVSGNREQYILKDAEFHLALAEFLGNRLIINIMRELFGNIEMMRFGNQMFGSYGGIYFHLLITDAIIQHDAKRARNLMYEHGLIADEMR